jgi:diadenylate cyclase
LCSIFHPGGTLHDGAVIIQGDRISGAACFLPLSTNPLLMTELGTRHRAALGISEEADCIAIVVSEETGKVSVAAFGEIQLDVPLERVEHLLSERLDRDSRRSRPPEAHHPAAMHHSTLDRP